MKRVIKIALFLLVFMALFVGALAWTSLAADSDQGGPVFTPKDRELINDYYARIVGNIGPGSLDRSTFSLAVEKDIVRGGHLPRYMEKDLKALPRALESQLSIHSGLYLYVIGHHVILMRSDDLSISDVIKGVAWDK